MKCTLQTVFSMLVLAFCGQSAFAQAVLIPPEKIEQVKAEWKKKTRGRPVVVNWLYMSVRSNQDPQPGMTGEPMFKNFVASVALAKKHKIPTTFMFEHQTLVDPRFREFMIREMKDDPLMEPAMNMQFGQELVEKAGLKWRGQRYVWDPAPSISYPSGFTPKEREKLVDLYMADFKQVFGRYPKTAGAWVVDTYALRYLKEKYGVIASAECPDQWRTDFYTLWGAPQNTPYVVSRHNAYMPAQTRKNSLGVAMFRMTGGVEPIHHYEGGAATYPYGSMQMPSLFISAGRYAEWWLNMLAETPLSIGNTTPGTETAWINSDSIEDLQRMVAQYRDLGLLKTETLSQTAESFLKDYPLTPPGAENALEDCKDTFAPATGWMVKNVKEFVDNNLKDQPEINAKIVENLPKVMNWDVPRKATWYSSRYYRCGLLWEGDEFRLRDLYLYDEDVPDSYLSQACRASDNVFMAMPVMDGMQWSSIAEGKMAGIRLVAVKPDGTCEVLKSGTPKLDTPDNKKMIVSFPLTAGGNAKITFDEDAATFEVSGSAAPKDWAMELTWHRPARAFWRKDTPPEQGANVDFFRISKVEPQALSYTWSPPTTLQQPELGLPRSTYAYAVKAAAGTFSQPAERVVLMMPASGKVKLKLAVKARRIVVPAAAGLAPGTELRNVALASLGADITASDFLANDTPDKLIDGVINHALEHRWHSDISQPHPHWLRLQFPKALPLRRVVFHASAVDCFPVELVVERQTADGKAQSVVNAHLTPAQTVGVDLPAVTTDNLSIRILNSNGGNSNYVQLNALEVLADVTEAQVAELARLAKASATDQITGPSEGEYNVALAKDGARADVSSTGYFGRNHPDYRRTDMAAGPGQLIDGRYISVKDALAWPVDPQAPEHGNRWISQLDQSNPHWAMIRFNGPKRICRVVLRCSLFQNYPTAFRGEYSLDSGRTYKTLFAVKNQKPGQRTLAMGYRFDPVVTDNFRLVIEKSAATSPAEDNTQLSEIEVYGQDATAETPKATLTQSAQLPSRALTPKGETGVIIEDRANEVEFRTPWQRVVLAKNAPRITSLCWDSMGKGEFGINLLMKGEGIAPRIDRPTYEPIDAQSPLHREGNVARYGPFEAAPGVAMVWEIRVTEKKVEMALATQTAQTLVIRPGLIRFAFDSGQTLTSPFYTPKRLGYATLPVILNAPDFGVASFQSKDMAGFRVQAGEYATPQMFVHCDLTPSLPTREDGLIELPRGNWRGSINWSVERIVPLPKVVSNEPRVQNLPRFVLNGLQYRPDQDMLCNSITSINCPFCLWEYAEVAQWLPVLPGGIDPCQQLRLSVDRYIAGTPGHTSTEWSIFSERYGATGDTPASFIYAMWTYVRKTGDQGQLQRWLPALDRIIAMLETADTKGDGLLHTTGPYVRSAAWFDTMSIRGLDAAFNIFSYRACQYASDLYRLAGKPAKAAACERRAAGIKKAFVPALLNPKTGIIAGGILEDGTVVDCWYVWINGMAICYGLVPDDLANQILDRFQAKFKEVGYVRFKNGLPNVLVPITCPPQITHEDGSPWNKFQEYLNGGATPAWSNFYIQALYQMGRRQEADAIFWPLVDSYGKGRFNGGRAYQRDGAETDPIKADKSEWWYWDGRPHHAEGYLTDMYHPFTVLWTGYYGLEFTPDGYRRAPWSPLKGGRAPVGLQYMGKTVKLNLAARDRLGGDK